MERITETISIQSIEDIPALDLIKSIPRTKTLKLIFEEVFQAERESIGTKLKEDLSDAFQVGVHMIEPVINIRKLITDQEIEAYQDFFEQCAKDYRNLGTELIFQLAGKLGVVIDDYPLDTFNYLKQGHQNGKINEWNYYIHGFHCGFRNVRTGQTIEVPLVFSQEFGDLDPYFFSHFIKSTPHYQPLPIEIYEDYADGYRIIHKMLDLGKFEKIHSNVGGHFGIVVADRKKIQIKTYEELTEQKGRSKKRFWDFFRRK